MPYTPLPQRPPAEQRAFLIFYARVMLREVRARRGHKGNEWMLRAAANARRQAAGIIVERDLVARMGA